jgi:hypothetical protein
MVVVLVHMIIKHHDDVIEREHIGQYISIQHLVCNR